MAKVKIKAEKKAPAIVINNFDPIEIIHTYAEAQRGKKIYSDVKPLDLSEKIYLDNIIAAAKGIEKSKLSKEELQISMMDMLTIGTSGHSEQLAEIVVNHYQNMAEIVRPKSSLYPLYNSLAKAVQPFGSKNFSLKPYEGEAKNDEGSEVALQQLAKILVLTK
jgi:hypothetical protein